MLKQISIIAPFAFLAPARKNRKPAFTPAINSVMLAAGILLAGANVALLASYLAGVNSYAAKGYEIKKLQTKLDKLNEENKRLTIRVSEFSSIASLEEGLRGSQYVPAGTPKFLHVNHYTQLPAKANY